MKSSDPPRVLVVHNRDYEGAEADPENRSRADVQGTALSVVQALAAVGCEAGTVGVGRDLHGAVEEITEFAPDVVFNLCESIDGASNLEPLLPLLLERAGLAYTGSSPLTLGMCVHKHRAKDALRGAGVPTPEAVVLTTPDVSRVAVPFPLIVKPAREDASVGITVDSVVHDRKALARQVTFVLARYRQPALVERYIEGREIYVSMLGRPPRGGGAGGDVGGAQMLPLYEIDFSEMPKGCPRIVSFDGKWVESSPEFRGTKPVPCEGLAPEVLTRIAEVAQTAFSAMELRDYARLDVRLSAEGIPYIIDVNPNCDLSEGAGFARAARAAGLGYDEVVRRIVDLALLRRPHADTIPLAARARAAQRNRSVLSSRPARRGARSG